MKKNTKVLLFVFLFLFSGFLVSVGTASALEYTLLEKIPGTDAISLTDLSQYVSAIYKAALIVVTLSAVLMLSIGGFMYLTSAGNTSSISTAKGIIYDSLIGLVIALSAWLILYIINPDLVEISLTPIPAASIVNFPAPTPSGIGTLPPQDTISLATEILTMGKITLQGDAQASCGMNDGTKVSVRRNIEDVAAGKTMRRCSNGCGPTSGCMNFSGISNTMLKAIKAVGQTHQFTIT
ncbi:MAG: hypothetical protein KBD27_03190, partial [Candidatus Moranbacteria bacterium]|nr:hypothetical protein [Candidatus Moranbacteria bacterium]